MTNILSRLFIPGPSSRYALGRWSSWLGPETDDYGSLAGVHLSRESALAVAAIYACVRVISYVTATLPVDTLRRVGEDRQPITPPTWLVRPDPSNPNVTRVMHFGQVICSMMFEGQGFTLALPSVFDPVLVASLDPRKVEIKSGPIYRVRLKSGGYSDYTPDQVIHIPHPLFLGDSQRAVSPIEALRQGMAISLAADRYGAKFYENGTILSGVIQVKGPMSAEDQDDMREKWAARYGGVQNAHKPGVLTQDAEWKPLGVTPEQAQFIEQRRYQAEEMARAYGVPPAIIGITTAGAVSYASVEQQNRAFVDFTLRPLVESIEAAYQRLIPGSDTYLKFNMRSLLRGDSMARAEYFSKLVGAGVYTPEEARALEDVGPLGPDDMPRINPFTSVAQADVNRKAQADAFKVLVDAGYPAPEAAGLVGLPPPSVQPDPTGVP